MGEMNSAEPRNSLAKAQALPRKFGKYTPKTNSTQYFLKHIFII